jgi:hypothetical protein
MQDLEKISVRQYDIYTLDKYLITFNSNIKYETYKCKWYYGIIFYVDDGKWDVGHNIYLGNRLLISEHQYWMKDIPFHEGTFSFLPKGIEVLTLR